MNHYCLMNHVSINKKIHSHCIVLNHMTDSTDNFTITFDTIFTFNFFISFELPFLFFFYKIMTLLFIILI